MTKLTTAAWAAHELGLAASFGGLLFGKLALNPNLEVLENKSDRGKLLNKTWNRYNAVNAASVGTAIATWLTGRSAISGNLALDKGQQPGAYQGRPARYRCRDRPGEHSQRTAAYPPGP